MTISLVARNNTNVFSILEARAGLLAPQQGVRRAAFPPEALGELRGWFFLFQLSEAARCGALRSSGPAMASQVSVASHHLRLPLSLLRTLGLHQAHLDHPGGTLHLKMFQLVTSPKALLPYPFTWSRDRGIRVCTSLGEDYSASHNNQLIQRSL